MTRDHDEKSASADHSRARKDNVQTVWVVRWKDVVAEDADLPGVWRRRDGGYHVRARVTDPRTNKMREVNRELPNVQRARDAFTWLQGEIDRIRAGVVTEHASSAPKFATYANAVFKRKIDLGKIRSPAGEAKWESILEHHLVPEFGDLLVDRMGPADIKGWQSRIASKIRAGKMAPTTANTILAVLQQITDDAVNDFDIRDPMRGIDPFDTREHATYTEEEPNALIPKDVPRFLGKLHELYPRHFAFSLLGFTTGLRPSSMRPLRREGPSADIKWDESVLLIRRSQTIGDDVMETTKNKKHQRLLLPSDLMEVLRWHVETQFSDKMRATDLLFPSVVGGFRARSCLDKPFADVAKKIGLGYTFTARGMRRTYQDMAREAGIHDAVTRAISGHMTQEMQLHYSTPADAEVRDAIAKVAGIATGGGDVIDLSVERSRRAAK